ncbi:hypothetical protein ACOMHN_011655 [Nucella lapillus]
MRMCIPGYGRQVVSRVYDNLEDIQPGLSRKVFGGVVVGAALSYVAVRGYRYYHARQIGRERGTAARLACQSLREHLNQREWEEGPRNRERDTMIVRLDMKDLKEKLGKGELKAVEVLRAYQRKALEVNDQLNCITEPILEAEAMARALDLLTPEQRGPLHGVPVSVKDAIHIKGYDCNVGFAAFVGEQAEEDAVLIQQLKSLGAVPFVRTNFPQGLLSYGCSNPIYGRTCNPHSLQRGSGGSSGGEGALLAAGGSVVGLGSDIGGSVRIPANMCGVYTLKPTAERIISRGHKPLLMGQTAVLGVVAPMARDMESLTQLIRAIYTPTMHQLEPTVAPFGFREEVLEKKGPLCIGFYTAIEGVASHPACVRAVMEAKAALEQKGHKLVQFTPPRAYEAFCDLWVGATFGDGGRQSANLLKDDVLDACVRPMYYMGKVPLPVKYIIAKLLAFVDPPGSQFKVAMCRLPRTVCDWWDLQARIMGYKMEFMEAWKRQGLDAVLCPGLPFPALTAGYEEVVFYSIAYTALFNLLNYPAGALPVTTVTDRDLQRLKDPSVYPCTGAFEKLVIQDSEGSAGLPVGVQCASLPFEEEVVLRVMRDIDSVVRKN